MSNPQASTFKGWPKNDETPKVVLKDNSKHMVEEKERLITNPTRCFKCNGLRYIAIHCPTKRTLIFCEDLNGWIEKDEEESLENIVDDGNSHEDGAIGRGWSYWGCFSRCRGRCFEFGACKVFDYSNH